MLQTVRYPVSHPLLKTLIKYFWVIETQSSFEVNHKLLPVSNIDFILNLSSPIKYTMDEKSDITPKGFHFNGIRNRYYKINQKGVLLVFGIAFFEAGLFPLLKIPLSEFKNDTIEIDLIIKGFTTNIGEQIILAPSIPEAIRTIEIELVKLVDIMLIPRKEIYELLRLVHSNINELSISLMCEQVGINQRKLERIFNQYVGISPKQFQRINRFRGVLHQLEKKRYQDFTLLAYDNEYYDQTHFIKDFKSFSGCTPVEFLNEKSSIKQITKYC